MASNPLKRLADALTGAGNPEQRATAAREAVREATEALAQAEAEHAAAHEAGDGPGILKAEAALEVADRAAKRADRALAVAEAQLVRAQAVAAAEAQRAGKAELGDVLQRRGLAINKIDAAVADIGAALAEIDAADEQLRQLQQSGVASRDATAGYNYGPAPTRRRIELALENAKVLPGAGAPDMPSLSSWHGVLVTTARG